MLQELKKEVFEANLDLFKQGMVIFTWGNVSGIDRDQNIMAIKPSGIDYNVMQVSDIVLVDLEGKVVEGKLNPSSDTPTHLELYKGFPGIRGIVHTHSTYATAWAQAGKPIPLIGTTQADYFARDIPCTPDMTEEEIEQGYEKETGSVIIRTFANLDPVHVPGVLVKNHGPFTWGRSPGEAVHNSIVLEEVARMAYLSLGINPDLTISSALSKKHFDRKHGKDAYYGQEH